MTSIERLQRKYVWSIFWREVWNWDFHRATAKEIDPDARSQSNTTKRLQKDGYIVMPLDYTSGTIFEMLPKIYNDMKAEAPKLLDVWSTELKGRKLGICHDAIALEHLNPFQQKFVLTNVGKGKAGLFRLYLAQVEALNEFKIGWPNEFARRVRLVVENGKPMHESMKEAVSKAKDEWDIWTAGIHGYEVQKDAVILVTSDSLISYSTSYLFNQHIGSTMCDRLKDALDPLGPFDQDALSAITRRMICDPSDWKDRLQTMLRNGMENMRQISLLVKVMGQVHIAVNDHGGWTKFIEELRVEAAEDARKEDDELAAKK